MLDCKRRPVLGADGVLDYKRRHVLGADGLLACKRRPVLGADGVLDCKRRPVLGADGVLAYKRRPVWGARSGDGIGPLEISEAYALAPSTSASTPLPSCDSAYFCRL